MGIQKTISRLPRRTNPRKGRPCLAPMPPGELEERIPSSSSILSSRRWQLERDNLVARICRCLVRGQVAGRPLHKMVVRFVWKWNGHPYKCDPERVIRLQYGTLKGLFYRYKNGGRTPSAIALRYHRGNQKALLRQVIELSTLCLAPEIKSFSAAYRKLASPDATESAYRYATPVRLRTAVAALLAHRRHEQVLEGVARRALEELAR